MAAFSIYIWNVRLSLAIAAEVKRRQPQTLVVAGGPQVPDRPPPRSVPDRASVRGRRLPRRGGGGLHQTARPRRTRDFSDVPGISFLDEDGELETHPKAPRIKDLEEIPSPYSSGAFDDLFAAQPDRPLGDDLGDQPRLPVHCAFCDWGSAIASKIFRFEMDRLGGDRLDVTAAHRVRVDRGRQLRRAQARPRDRSAGGRLLQAHRLPVQHHGPEHQERHRSRLPIQKLLPTRR